MAAAKRAVRALPHVRAALVSQACSVALRTWDDLSAASQEATAACVQLVRELVSEWRTGVSADPFGHSMDDCQLEVSRIEGARAQTLFAPASRGSAPK